MEKNTVKAAIDYRYERKFLISELDLDEIKLIVKLHPALFTEIYHQRYVNNIYFDTLCMKNYFDNVNGSSDRIKVRIRWYGNLFGLIEKPVLELKIKKALLGTKKSYPLTPISLDGKFNFEALRETFKNSDIPDALRHMLMQFRPVLINRYSRSYYRSADGNYRITIDSDLDFYAIKSFQNSYMHKYTRNNILVLELKYDHDKDQYARQISTLFPFRLTRNSKYLDGLQKLML